MSIGLTARGRDALAEAALADEHAQVRQAAFEGLAAAAHAGELPALESAALAELLEAGLADGAEAVRAAATRCVGSLLVARGGGEGEVALEEHAMHLVALFEQLEATDHTGAALPAPEGLVCTYATAQFARLVAGALLRGVASSAPRAIS